MSNYQLKHSVYFPKIINYFCCFVTKLCLTLCDWMGYSLQVPSVHVISQARIQDWFAISTPGDLPNTGTESRSPTLQADSLESEPPE